MSKKRGIWAVGLLPSAVLDWYKRTAGRYQRFAGIIANNLRTVGPENQFEVEQVISVDNPLHASPSCGSSLHRPALLRARSARRYRLFCDVVLFILFIALAIFVIVGALSIWSV
jgi:hypothetical protein